MEETRLVVTVIEGIDSMISTRSDSFDTECIRPYAIYQTTSGSVDSFCAYFRCKATGDIISHDDDTKNPRWVTIDKLQKIIDKDEISQINKAVVIMYIQDNNK